MIIDQVISHYRVLGTIGEGGMGEVYLGLDETLRRRVALKAIRPEHRLDPATKARFLREARTLSQLDHPNICRVYDYIETADRDWIVLELVEGETLSLALKRGLPDADRLKIAQQIAAVLVATHAAGVVHRDLKPVNVMLSPAGDVKVLDFGLSAPVAVGTVAAPSPHAIPIAALAAAALEETRAADDVSPSGHASATTFRSAAGAIKGTVGYMSPEQARGEMATTASDMYSYGLLLQELFTGQRPYETGATYLELLERARRAESIEATGLRAPIAALVKRLKSPPPAQRPTAVDTLNQLHWIADAPKRLRRNVIVAALVMAAALGAVKYTIDLSRERNAALAARDEAQQRRGQAENLIGFMVGDLRTKLTAVGRLEILDDVGKKALEYFSSVKAGTLTDEELYRRSQALHQLGQVRQARADLPGALQAYEDSLAQAGAVVQRHPENAEWQLGLGTSHFYIGDLKMRGGDLAAALAHFQAYQQIAQQLATRSPENTTYQLEVSYGHSNVAAIYSRQGNLQGAREQLEIVSRLQTALAAKTPSDVTLQLSRANNFNRLGIVLDSLGELTDAAASFGHELEVYATVLAADSKNTQVRRRAVVGRAYRGAVLKALALVDEAAADLDAARAEATSLTAIDPTNAVWQRDVAATGNLLARLDIDAARLDRAHARFVESREILTALLKKNPGRALEQRDLAATHVALAEVLRRQRQLTAARAEAEAALAILSPAAEKNPQDADTARELAIAEIEAGTIAAAMDQRARARASWTGAAARLAPLSNGSRDRRVLDPWVRALWALGRSDEAKRGVDRLTAIGYRDRGFMAFVRQLDASPPPQ